MTRALAIDPKTQRPRVSESGRLRSKDLAGQKFGRLTVLHRRTDIHDGHNAFWQCRCECGALVVRSGSRLRDPKRMSCGCALREATRRPKWSTHGLSRTREYRIWRGMIDRCCDPTSHAFKDYGGRGIFVCDEWRDDCARFIADMGPSNDLQLDRIDNDGPYSRANCRWADAKTQANNTRRNKRIEFDGRTMTLAEWSRETGIKLATISARLLQGRTVAEALSPLSLHPFERHKRISRKAAAADA